MCTPSLLAADRFAKDGIEVEVIDLPTLLPFDKDAILRSVERASRLLIVHEDVKTLGLGAELPAVIVEERFAYLDAPVMRVTYPDTHCPFSHVPEVPTLLNFFPRAEPYPSRWSSREELRGGMHSLQKRAVFVRSSARVMTVLAFVSMSSP
jgi:hypothetical protein